MQSFGARPLASIAASNKTVYWSFIITDALANTYKWSTGSIPATVGGTEPWEEAHTFKIINFSGVTLRRNKSESGIHAANDVSFAISNKNNALTASNFAGGTVLINLLIDDGIGKELCGSWRYRIKTASPYSQQIDVVCEDFVQEFLSGSYPNTLLVSSIFPSLDAVQNDSLCVPEPYGTCYIPLRSVYAGSDRYYLLGDALNTYSISEVRSPRELGSKIVWTSGGYTFAQSTVSGWRLFQMLIAAGGTSGIFLSGDRILDVPTKFNRSDTALMTDPAAVIRRVLNNMGALDADIDLASFSVAAATFASWGLAWNFAYWSKEDRPKVLALLLCMCHSCLVIGDKIGIQVLSKVSQKTITSADVLKMQDVGQDTFKYTDAIAEKSSDSGYVAFQIAGESQDKFLQVPVPAKTTSDVVDKEVVTFPGVQDTQHVQKLGSLYYQRKLLKVAEVVFSAKGTCVALRPDDVITINHVDYGGTYDVLIDEISIQPDISVNISAIRFSASLDDWEDLSPAVIPVTSDTIPKIQTPAFADARCLYTDVIQLEWLPIDDPLLGFFEVRTDLNWGSATNMVYQGKSTSYTMVPVEATYTFYLKSHDTFKNYSDAYDTIVMAYGLPIPPNVTNLRVVGGLDAATNNSPDCAIEWDSATLAGYKTEWISNYRVDVYTGTTLRRTDYVGVPAYTYTLDKNVADGAPPVGDLIFHVRTVGKDAQISATPTILNVSNPTPSSPVVTVNYETEDCILSWVPCADPDFDHAVVNVYSDSGRTSILRTVDAGKSVSFLYTYAMNNQDNPTHGSPWNVYFRVYLVDVFGQNSQQDVTASNATPDYPVVSSISSTLGNVCIVWDPILSALYDVVEIWRSMTNDLSSATMVGETRGITFIDGTVSVGNVYYYWFRSRNTSGNHSPYDRTQYNGHPVTVSGVDLAEISADIVTIDVVTSLPVDFVAYPQGAMVFLLTDNKLYRSTGSAWTTEVPSTDISGVIPAAQGGVEPVGSLPALPDAAYPVGSVVFYNDLLYRNTAGAGWVATTPASGTDAPIPAKYGGIEIVSNNPTLPNVNYPEGSVVYNTTDHKLWANRGGTWVGTTDASNIQGAVPARLGGVETLLVALPSLPDINYPVGCVVYYQGKLYRNVADAWNSTYDVGPIDASQVTTGYLNAARIQAGTIVGQMIAAATLTADLIQAGAIHASQLAAEELITLSAQIRSAIINDAHISALDAAKITTGYLNAARILAGSIGVDHLAANSVNAGKIQAGIIAASHLRADTAVITNALQVGNNIIGDRSIINDLSADKITAGTLNAARIGAGTVTATHIGTNQIVASSANIGNLVVDTLHVKDGAISSGVGFQFDNQVDSPQKRFYNAIDVTTDLGIAVTISTVGGVVQVFSLITLENNVGGSFAPYYQIYIYKCDSNGDPVYASPPPSIYYLYFAPSGGGRVYQTGALMFYDVSPLATQKYTLRLYGGESGADTQVRRVNIFASNYKK